VVRRRVILRWRSASREPVARYPHAQRVELDHAEDSQLDAHLYWLAKVRVAIQQRRVEVAHEQLGLLLQTPRGVAANEGAIPVNSEPFAHGKHVRLLNAERVSALRRDSHGPRYPDGLWPWLWPRRSTLLCNKGVVVRLWIVGRSTWLREAARWITAAAEQRLRFAAELGFASAVKDVFPRLTYEAHLHSVRRPV